MTHFVLRLSDIGLMFGCYKQLGSRNEELCVSWTQVCHHLKNKMNLTDTSIVLPTAR